MEGTDASLAALIKRIRGPLTQEAFADATGLNINWLKTAESGRIHGLTHDKYDRLATAPGLVDGDREALASMLPTKRRSLDERVTQLESDVAEVKALVLEIRDLLSKRRGSR